MKSALIKRFWIEDMAIQEIFRFATIERCDRGLTKKEWDMQICMGNIFIVTLR